MQYNTADICRILNIDAPKQNRQVSVLLTDSRSLTYPESSIFFAISTNTNDGHRYIRSLYEMGVRTFCVTHIPDDMTGQETSDATFLVVPDVTSALHRIATWHRNKFSIPVIGITGSRGKTTVKEWLYQLLSSDHNVVRSPRSFNSQIGVPLSVWEITPETELAVFEAGISQRGEMSRLQRIIRPDVTIITNVHSEHSEGFSSKRQKCSEKVILAKDSKCVIYCADDTLVDDTLDSCGITGIRLGWSISNPDATLYIKPIETTTKGTRLSYTYLDNTSEIFVPFTTEAELQNVAHCLALLLYIGIDREIIKDRMSRLTKVGTRLNVIEGVNNCMVIYDSYTSDLHSLAPAIDFMCRRRTTKRSSTLILSDVMHENMIPAQIYQAVAQLVKYKNIDRVIGIGEEFIRNSRYFDSMATFYPDTATFMSQVSPGDFENELILVKGAPEFHFDLIADMLEARQHETVLEVNLDAIVHNFNMFRAMVRPTTGIVCMVKASGYGAGSYELAKTLQSQGASYLAVAVLDEGVDLRRAGITMPIMVLNPKVVNYRTLFAYNLEPEIFSLDILDEIIREGEKYGISDYPVHIKFDTGMHRLGFTEKDLPELIDVLRRQKVIRPASAFSHLAAADDPSMDDYTRQQFQIFDNYCDTLQRAFRHHIMRHILNSTGISRFPQHQHDLVRLGICLYGIPTMNDGTQDGLRQVSSLTTTIISIKEWPEDTTIGYNRRGVCHRPSRIATIPVGYADGINRHLGNGGMNVMVRGLRCPSIGNICMDACMIDVTDVPGCTVGDRVEIFGPNIPVAELAETLDTIPYEVLTSVSSRVKRLYYRE